jgi:predicted DNA-binding ribbon-helix-helix protein
MTELPLLDPPPRQFRKTMRIRGIRTSIKLEPSFWNYLEEMAAQHGMRLSVLVGQMAAASGQSVNFASTLRTAALVHAQRRAAQLQHELERRLAGGTSGDLLRIMEACPLPVLFLDTERRIRAVNPSLVAWLNLDARAILGQRLDSVMLLQAPSLKEAWMALAGGARSRLDLRAIYVSPGRVRTAQATALALSGPEEGQPGGFVMLFTTS